ncbi:hypothetical protein CR164_08470 [Prosthecochloris marina]|uniref:Uncharacterized protein n=1 Tax=Prosthecochloris marina TaxID=2017681 RepID=A0A317T553_9CHLB|nr:MULTISPECIES: hypothetical protein [Prosthecochloris]PWW81842.1 hypothetical protein CR164_08470 [Prosthecochloris marina]UZJ42391.1 hypothetical protein OO006_05375 [Prosthecochloris sp. SCSIO W1101]
MEKRVLIGLTIFIGILVAVSIYCLDRENLSAFGSILSGAGSLLAVLWFSASLRYQSRQLEEQRKQFTSQYLHLQETGRRDALMVAKGILDRAEAQAIAHNGEINSIIELSNKYILCKELKPLTESTDPQVVTCAYESWMKKEGAALIFLNGIKSAAEVYLRSVGKSDVDYSKGPEDFYYIYSPLFATQPFFNTSKGTADLISEFMVQLAPGRKAADIAFFAANAKLIGPKIINMDKLRSNIKKHVEAGYKLPAIAQDL